MDTFNYLAVLISIVLGLGITQLLAGFAGLVRARDRVTMYWPVPVQMAAMFLIHVQLWWALFGLRGLTHWTIAQFIVVLMQPVTLFLMTALITPDLSGAGRIDLRAVYFREARWFFGAILVALAVSLAKTLVTAGSLPNRLDLTGHVVFAAVAIAGIVSSRDVVHKIIAPLSLALYSTYVALLFVQLP
jgi:hypothetical protein